MKKISIIFSLIILFIICLVPKTYAYTSNPLDEIISFDIYAHVRDDATVDFRYDIKWKVLDSSSEGVTWIYVGIPNKHCDEVKKLSSDVKKAYYKINNTDTTIRCDLNREYLEGEIIDISFSFHQTHMFTYNEDLDTNTKLVTYSYTPGWFDDINVKRITIHWEKENVYFDDAKGEDEKYFIWETSLAQGERTKVQVSYDEKVFPNINPKDVYDGSKDYSEQRAFMWVVIVIISIFVILGMLSRIFRRPSYYRTRGFYPYGRRLFYRNYYYGVDNSGTRKVNPYVSSGGSHSHSGHSCACACACACAGGGRAGCSKKDFYKGKIKIDDLIDKIN